MKRQKTQNTHDNVEGKNKVRGLIRQCGFDQKKKEKKEIERKEKIDLWNRIGIPEVNLCTYGQLIYGNGDKNTQWRTDNLFSKWCKENLTALCKRMRLYYLTLCTKINSKWIKELI